MNDILEIGEVAERTGLSHRALRFYEARGLVTPLRTAAGRRVYGAGELARLNAVMALKRAGFSLAEIGRTLAGRQADLGALVVAQIADLDRKLDELTASRSLLATVQSRIDRREPIDVATLCSLIRAGENHMKVENWKAVTDRYTDPGHTPEWDAAYVKMPADFDHTAYSAKWDDLAGRIEAALPMDPASSEARALYDEWQALLAPFAAIATPGMKRDVSNLYDHIDEWKGEQKPPFSAAVWRFIQAVGAHR